MCSACSASCDGSCGRTLERQPAALDVRDVEQILDQAIHPLGRFPNRREQLASLRVVGRRTLLEHARAHRDRADRIAQVVRHDAQHLVARAVRVLRRVVEPRVLQARSPPRARTSQRARAAAASNGPAVPARMSVSAPRVSPATQRQNEHRRARRALANAESPRDRRCSRASRRRSSSTNSRRSRGESTSMIGDGESGVEAMRASASSAGVSSARCRVLATRVNAPPAALAVDEVEQARVGEPRNRQIDDRAHRRVDGERIARARPTRREKPLVLFGALLDR